MTATAKYRVPKFYLELEKRIVEVQTRGSGFGVVSVIIERGKVSRVTTQPSETGEELGWSPDCRIEAA